MSPDNIILPDKCIYPPKYPFLTRLYFYYNNVGTWFWDKSNNILYWDKVMQKINDLPTREKQLVGTYEELFAKQLIPEDQERIKEKVEFSEKYNLEFTEEFRIKTSKGATKFIRAKGHWLYTETGESCAMVGINWEIFPVKPKLKEIELTTRSKYSKELLDFQAKKLNLTV